jgi:hypothetical protein
MSASDTVMTLDEVYKPNFPPGRLIKVDRESHDGHGAADDDDRRGRTGIVRHGARSARGGLHALPLHQ